MGPVPPWLWPGDGAPRDESRGPAAPSSTELDLTCPFDRLGFARVPQDGLVTAPGTPGRPWGAPYGTQAGVAPEQADPSMSPQMSGV